MTSVRLANIVVATVAVGERLGPATLEARPIYDLSIVIYRTVKSERL